MMSDASPLRPGLSYALFTQTLHFVPQVFWQESVPHNVDLQKYYYIPEIEFLQQEAESAQALGSGAVEEWVKGLPSRGRSIHNFAMRCEEWEFNGGLDDTLRSLFNRRNDPVGADFKVSWIPTTAGRSAVPSTLQSMPTLPVLLPPVLPAMPLHTYGLAPGIDAPLRLPSKPSDASSMGSQTSNHRYKAAPSSRDLARIRANKKAEIIERCRALNPPIRKDMLERLDAFNNALQVSMPLNESSWETLKSLLLPQRAQVDLQDEARNSATTAPVPGRFTAPSRSDEYILAHADVPVKEKLCQIAEEFIKQKFSYGAWVTYPTAPKFAAEVLAHTREAFMEDRARIKALRSQAGYITLSMPQDETLRYEHMKWVFDQTIRPRTEQIRKDLFLCAGCPTGGTVKYFPFESMIQHFSFKHDTTFTTDAPKAFWKSEWPKIPPFNVHPERVHTPEPSVTHTPTLSHQPLPVISPGSVTTMAAPVGRRTPDTMSLLSGNTNPFSASGRSARSRHMESAGPMYEVQREYLSTEIVRGWTLVTSVPRMPLSLQLRMTLDFAATNFSKKYKNEPPLDLLDDSISMRSEFREPKDFEVLRCAECVIYGQEGAQMEWSLQDLVAHFRKMHIENNRAGTKLDWKTNMISLPEPAFIRSLLSNDNVPTVLRDLLKDAETQAVIEKATTDSTKGKSLRQQNPILYLDGSQDEAPNRAAFTAADVGQINQPLFYTEDRHRNHMRPLELVVTNYRSVDSARDTWSASSHTVKAEDMSSIDSRRPTLASREHYSSHMDTVLHDERPISSIEAGTVLVDGRPNESLGESMVRSETLQSRRSRGEVIPRSDAEDFLSTIDAQLDVEMAGSDSGEARSNRASQPVSRTNSARISHRTSPNRANEAELRRLSTGSAILRHQQEPDLHMQRNDYTNRTGLPARGSTQAMERQPSRVIEFDRQGNPLRTASQVYQETSPPTMAVPRQYIDSYGQPIERSSYGRGYAMAAQEIPATHYMDDQYSRASYAPLEYRPERIVDPVTGQVYVAERPPVRQLIEIGGPPRAYEGVRRPVNYEYREVDPGAYGTGPLRYVRYPADFPDPRYEGR